MGGVGTPARSSASCEALVLFVSERLSRLGAEGTSELPSTSESESGVSAGLGADAEPKEGVDTGGVGISRSESAGVVSALVSKGTVVNGGVGGITLVASANFSIATPFLGCAAAALESLTLAVVFSCTASGVGVLAGGGGGGRCG